MSMCEECGTVSNTVSLVHLSGGREGKPHALGSTQECAGQVDTLQALLNRCTLKNARGIHA